MFGLSSNVVMLFGIIGVAVIIFIILFMSYYMNIITIANFAYPNARLKAIGNPFINKEKLLDTIEAGEFSQKDLEELMGSGTQKVNSEDRKKIDDMITDARSKLENASSEEERESVLEEIKASIIEKQKKGELPGQGKLNEKLKKEGKTMEEYMKEKGL